MIAMLHSGTLNIYGSGLFGEHFLKYWQSEGFPDYIFPQTETSNDSLLVLKRLIVAVDGGGGGTIAGAGAGATATATIPSNSTLVSSSTSKTQDQEQIQKQNQAQEAGGNFNSSLSLPSPVSPSNTNTNNLATNSALSVQTEIAPKAPPKSESQQRRSSIEDKIFRAANILPLPTPPPPPPGSSSRTKPPPPPAAPPGGSSAATNNTQISGKQLDSALQANPELVEMLLLEMKKSQI